MLIKIYNLSKEFKLIKRLMKSYFREASLGLARVWRVDLRHLEYRCLRLNEYSEGFDLWSADYLLFLVGRSFFVKEFIKGFS